MTLAILITSHNRCAKTLACLRYLDESLQNSAFEYSDIYLVIDGSMDDTHNQVLQKHPKIKIILGDGNLFWNGGMRLAWSRALEAQTHYDFYLWLNDDTYLFKEGITTMLNDYFKAKNEKGSDLIITGACKSMINDSFSYGGKLINGKSLVPKGFIQECQLINGNCVLVSDKINQILGILSEKFTHSMGDYDYGLRAKENDIKSYCSSSYIAYCEPNSEIPLWCNPELSLKRRYKTFLSPKGLNIKEYIYFRKRHWPKTWLFYIVKAYIKMIFPKYYQKINNR